jgi:hypothetical protein
MPTTRIVNVKNAPFDVYIGRPGQLGNPYRINKNRDRATVLKLFEGYARRRMATDKEFAALVKSLHGKTLGCYCAPLGCHGHVLAKLAEEANT